MILQEANWNTWEKNHLFPYKDISVDEVERTLHSEQIRLTHDQRGVIEFIRKFNSSCLGLWCIAGVWYG